MLSLLQLKLRHLINKEILIYPGYVPLPGVNYRVFHYGLEYSVGNWSFDKANWRETDIVNTCWAKFPDPPDPATINSPDPNIQRRDLLSIECARTLNKALLLHHKRNCPDSHIKTTSNQEMEEHDVLPQISDKLAENLNIERDDRVQTAVSREVSLRASTEHVFSAFRFWMIALWAFAIFGFFSVMSMIWPGRKGDKTRSKAHRNKRKTSFSGFSDANGHDRHNLHKAEMSFRP